MGALYYGFIKNLKENDRLLLRGQFLSFHGIYNHYALMFKIYYSPK